jgi:hypothetical protein
MSIVDERGTSSWGSNGYWGLTQQNGPWQTTKKDIRNLKRSGPVLGGGLGMGGTAHAGHGNYNALINPYQQNGRKPISMPSKYAMRDVVVKAPDANKQKREAGVFKPSIGRPVVVNIGLSESGRQDFQQCPQDHQGGEPQDAIDHVKQQDTRDDLEFKEPEKLHSKGYKELVKLEPSLVQSSFSRDHDLRVFTDLGIKREDYLPSGTSSYMSRDYPMIPSASPRAEKMMSELENLDVEKNNFLNLVYPGSEPSVATFEPPNTRLTMDSSFVENVTKSLYENKRKRSDEDGRMDKRLKSSLEHKRKSRDEDGERMLKKMKSEGMKRKARRVQPSRKKKSKRSYAEDNDKE